MIHVNINAENIVQVSDRTRVDIGKTFQVSEPYKLIEIRAEDGADYITVYDSLNDKTDSEDMNIDWAYKSAGTHTIDVKVTRVDDSIYNEQRTITVISEEEDKLFSKDDDVIFLETEILYFLPKGKDTFTFLHRKAQAHILEELYFRGVKNSDDDFLTKENIVQTRELKDWSKYLVLQWIFEDQITSPDDVYSDKARKYLTYADSASRKNQFLKLDKNIDGRTEKENVQFSIGSVVRR